MNTKGHFTFFGGPPKADTICVRCLRPLVEHLDVGTDDPVCPALGSIRKFDTGATRNLEGNKLDYEGFLSPSVLRRYAEYMQEHRKQKDGALRDSDNWQKGIPRDVYVKSLVRHTMDFWRAHRGETVLDPDSDAPVTDQELACAIMFNVMGWLHETLKDG